MKLFSSITLTALIALLALLALLDAPRAHAQLDISVNDQAFTDRATPTDPDPDNDPVSAFLTGDGDLLLLNDRKHITVRSTTDWFYTNNAQLTNDNRVRDTYSRQELALRGSTRVDQTWDVFLEGGLISTEFVDEDQLSSDTLFARTGASTAWRGGTLGGSLAGNFIRQEDFDEGLIDQLVLTGFYLKPYRLSPDWLLSTRVVASQTWADPHDFTHFRLTGGADLVTPLLPQVAWITGAEVYGAWYADFFPQAGAGDRADFGIRTRTLLQWTICENASLSGILSYNYQDSSISFLDHDELNLGVSLQLTARF